MKQKEHMRTFLYSLIVILISASCSSHRDNVTSRLTLTRSSTEYSKALKNGTNGDPFTLRDFIVKDDSAYLTVSYGGGCKEHKFEVIWSEKYHKTDPPETGIIVVHDSNGDNCKSLITETFAFNIAELTGPVAYNTVLINVLNGASLSDSLTAGGWNPPDRDAYQVVFPQGTECQVEVTASTVVCGAGLYNNLWLALNDSVSSGVPGHYFKKYLQPVALTDATKGFVPVPGKKYLIGATIQREHPYQNVVVCLAFSGPSVPVKINCAAELK
ncbi:MAG TPA: hypothetical protein VK155_09305 [Bacteroidales bacterium]|nr:hypothetical protein [Bacteroidales bacterium]